MSHERIIAATDQEAFCDSCLQSGQPLAVFAVVDSEVRCALCYSCLQCAADMVMGQIEAKERSAYTHPDNDG